MDDLLDLPSYEILFAGGGQIPSSAGCCLASDLGWPRTLLAADARCTVPLKAGRRETAGARGVVVGKPYFVEQKRYATDLLHLIMGLYMCENSYLRYAFSQRGETPQNTARPAKPRNFFP